MAIKFLNDQPIDFRGHLPSYSVCKSNSCDSYCSLYDSTDYLKFQFSCTPVNLSELLPNASLINNNTELVSNGNFDSGTTGWILSNYIYDTPNQRLKSTANTGYAKQNISVINGKYYDILFTVTIPIGGYMEWYVGTQQQANITQSGTYSVRAVSGTGGYIQFNSNATNTTIDSVSVKDSLIGTTSLYPYIAATLAWRYDQAAKYLYKIAGSTDNITTSVQPAGINGFLRFQFDINNTPSGQSIQLILDGANFSTQIWDTYNADGHIDVYIQYFGLNPGQELKFIFAPTNGWNGRISNLSCLDYTFTSAINLVGIDVNYNQNLYPYISQTDEFITVNAPIQELNLDNGRYKICIDEVATNITQKDMIPTYAMQEQTDWGGDAKIVAGDYLYIDTDNTQQYTLEYLNWDPDMYASSTMAFDYDIYTNDWNTAGAPASLHLVDLDTNSIVATLITNIQANHRYTGSIVVNVDNNNWIPAFRVEFFDPPGYNSDFQFTQIRLVQTGLSALTYCSNCIDIQNSHRCSLWIAGSCDTEAFGFNFANNFEIAGRVRAMFINPKYKGTNQRYIDNNGKSIITASSSGKIYTFFIDYAPEKTHDWLRLALACDTVKIGTTVSNTTEWISLDADYNPEWVDNLGNFPLAQCRVEIQAKVDEKYNNNAG